MHRAGRCRGLSLALMALAWNCLPMAVEAGAGDGNWQEHATHIRADPAVHTALLFASRKLSSTRCQEVFADFNDPAGRTLADKLETLGETASSYLTLIQFFDAGEEGPCHAGLVLAFTVPGSHAVYLCGRRFRTRVWHSPGWAAAVLIHEELHSLGLGEDPPSSAEITLRVLGRCGV